ncbi:MAG TPA: YggS family pyridoxal phosphate-dependent enzyme [Phycisphaerae bacterium]|nr:YggS family pyridoxal phosphate-dependent enzyme [Phycisphaerae bacterium]
MRRKLRDNLRRVRDRMANACIRAKRKPKEVTLVAVTKSVGVDVIRQLLELDCCELGESRAQELSRRAAMIKEHLDRRSREPSDPAPPQPNWHMVGHVQRNKVKPLLPWVRMFHALDSLRLAEDLDNQAGKLDLTVDALVQINAADEPQKFGVAVGAVPHLIEQVVSLPNMRVCGLMAMAPLTEDTSRLDWVFERVQEIFTDLQDERFTGKEFRHLSMGMSNDFEIAIEHGATMIRVGTALFEGLAPG